MKNNKLNILYTLNKEILGQSYRIVKVFDETNFIEIDKSEMNFNTLDELASFGVELLQEFKLSHGYIIANTEFNNALRDSVKTRSDFGELFEKFGTKIEVPESEDTKGIFGRIFN